MDENKQISSLNAHISTIAKTVKALEEKVAKNEQLLLLSFTHLYNKIEEESNTSKPNSSLKDIIDLQSKEFDKKLSSLRIICEALQEETNCIRDKISSIEISDSEAKKAKSIKTAKKNAKKRRPWHYFISKHWKYKKLLERKEALEIEIEERNLERIRKLEKERLLKEKQKKEAEERKQKEEERLRQERRKQSQKKIEEILRGINNK